MSRFFYSTIGRQVQYVNSGTVSIGTGNSSAPGFPANIVAGRLLILRVYHRSSGQGITGGAAGFDLLFSDIDSGGFTKQTIMGKIADGSETGTLAINFSGGGVLSISRISQYKNNALTDWLDGDGLVTTNSTTVTHADITSRKGSLAVAFVGMSDDVSMSPFTGGYGSWTERSEDSSSLGDDGAIQLLTAPIRSHKTLTGGSYTLGSSEVYMVRSFAIRPYAIPPDEAPLTFGDTDTLWGDTGITFDD